MSKWLLIVGAVLGVVVAVLVSWHIQNVESAQKAVSFLRLKPEIALAKGQKVTGNMLATESLPEKFKDLTKLAIADNTASRQWIEGRRVSKDVSAGSLLLHEQFIDEPGERFAAKITKGMRALTISALPTTVVAFFVQPGSRVDIVGTFQRRENQSVTTKVPSAKGAPTEVSMSTPVDIVETRTILQNVKVLAVDQATTRTGYQRTAKGYVTVTVELSPQDAEKVIFASSQTRQPLSLVLRNPEDDSISEIPSTNWQSMTN